MKLTHTDERGRARMVDVTGKPATQRKATASARVFLKRETLRLILANEVKKGDVLAVARIAGIQAAKKTPGLIPLCHPINITGIDIGFSHSLRPPSITITSTISVNSQTGVEMEAMTSVAVAALAVYDMCKAVDKGIVIGNIMLLEKSGGRSGVYKRAKP
jgi:cyclic pyranopterin phosphate synthase